MAISIPIIFINFEGIHIYQEHQNLMGPLSILSTLSAWCQVIFKIQKPKLVKTTLEMGESFCLCTKDQQDNWWV
jgi:hypothetical protein